MMSGEGKGRGWEVWVFRTFTDIELTNLSVTFSDVDTLLVLCVLYDNKRSTERGL